MIHIIDMMSPEWFDAVEKEFEALTSSCANTETTEHIQSKVQQTHQCQTETRT